MRRSDGRWYITSGNGLTWAEASDEPAPVEVDTPDVAPWVRASRSDEVWLLERIQGDRWTPLGRWPASG